MIGLEDADMLSKYKIAIVSLFWGDTLEQLIQ